MSCTAGHFLLSWTEVETRGWTSDELIPDLVWCDSTVLLDLGCDWWWSVLPVLQVVHGWGWCEDLPLDLTASQYSPSSWYHDDPDTETQIDISKAAWLLLYPNAIRTFSFIIEIACNYCIWTTSGDVNKYEWKHVSMCVCVFTGACSSTAGFSLISSWILASLPTSRLPRWHTSRSHSSSPWPQNCTHTQEKDGCSLIVGQCVVEVLARLKFSTTIRRIGTKCFSWAPNVVFWWLK